MHFLCTRLALMSLIVALVIGLVGYLFYIMPTSFVPQEDQGLISVAEPQIANLPT